MKSLYEAQATAIGGRTGAAASSDGTLKVALSTPMSLGGEGGDGTNPEQLFAAAYAACFLHAIRLVAGQSKVAVSTDSNVTATVGIGLSDDGPGFALRVALAIDLPGLDAATAADLVDQAHATCPYSKALRDHVGVALSLV
jgi:Ohr subfamily peroxiredoxin